MHVYRDALAGCALPSLRKGRPCSPRPLIGPHPYVPHMYRTKTPPICTKTCTCNPLLFFLPPLSPSPKALTLTRTHFHAHNIPTLSSQPPPRKLSLSLLFPQGAHSRLIVTDPYANAFLPQGAPLSPHSSDHTSKPSYAGYASPLAHMHLSTPSLKPWYAGRHSSCRTREGMMRSPVFERKWELDSLASALRLASEYVAHTGDVAPIDSAFLSSVKMIISTMYGEHDCFANPFPAYWRSTIVRVGRNLTPPEATFIGSSSSEAPQRKRAWAPHTPSPGSPTSPRTPSRAQRALPHAAQVPHSATLKLSYVHLPIPPPRHNARLALIPKVVLSFPCSDP